MSILILAFLAIFAAKILKIWRIDLQSYGFMLILCALLHLVLMFYYYGNFAITNDSFYLAVSATCLAFLILGVRTGEFLATKIRWAWWVKSRSGEVLGRIHYGVMAFVLLVSVLNVYSYVRDTGSFNPLIGIQRYLSGDNSASEMWATSGALRYGEGRGVGEGSDWLSYILSRFSMLIYLLLGVLRPYAFALGAGAYFLTDMLALSAGYFSRTTVLLRAGLLALYGDARIHKFRPLAILSLLFVGLLIFLFLHLGRIGELTQPGGGISGKSSIAALETAAIGTFEPVGFAFRYYSSFGANSFEENIDHFSSYFGAAIPRFFWADKPYYAFEPDLTMKLTQQNIGGVNVVRTFSIIGEGLMVGGVWGVALISFLYAALTSFTLKFLEKRPEFIVVRIYLLLIFVLGFRLSLFTVWTGTFVLGLIPLGVVWCAFNLCTGSFFVSENRPIPHVANRTRNTE